MMARTYTHASNAVQSEREKEPARFHARTDTHMCSHILHTHTHTHTQITHSLPCSSHTRHRCRHLHSITCYPYPPGLLRGHQDSQLRYAILALCAALRQAPGLRAARLRRSVPRTGGLPTVPSQRHAAMPLRRDDTRPAVHCYGAELRQHVWQGEGHRTDGEWMGRRRGGRLGRRMVRARGWVGVGVAVRIGLRDEEAANRRRNGLYVDIHAISSPTHGHSTTPFFRRIANMGAGHGVRPPLPAAMPPWRVLLLHGCRYQGVRVRQHQQEPPLLQALHLRPPLQQ